MFSLMNKLVHVFAGQIHRRAVRVLSSRGANTFARVAAVATIAFVVTACVFEGGDSPVVSAVSGEVRTPTGHAGPLSEGRNRFVFADWGGPDIPVWTYVPTRSDPAVLPIVIVMHGVGRDADRYRDEWSALAQLNRFVIVAPEFSRRRFPDAEGYNLGNVFEQVGGDRLDEATWSFSAIEPLFDAVTGILNSTESEYTLYGHSAGSQFVHRFLFYKPEARVKRYIPANAGWYTLPDLETPYPYGLSGSGVGREALVSAFQKDVVILLGDHDDDAAHPSLRRTPEALSQGAHRFARGKFFFARAKQKAEEFGVPFNWSMRIVANAKHSNAEMAIGAVSQALIERAPNGRQARETRPVAPRSMP